VCSTWSGSGSQTLSGNGQVVVTLTGGASNNKLTVSTASSCTFHFGTIDLGSTGYLASGSHTYSGNGSNKSRVAYSGGTTNPTLTITLGDGTDSNSVTSSTLAYTPDANLKDTGGNGVTAGSSTGQSF
jgi:hypothetical protein